MSNLIRTTTIADKSFLTEKMMEALDQKLLKQEMEVKGFSVQLRRKGKIDLAVVAKSILIALPIEIILKRPEGLFTMEASGAALLEVRMDIDIKADFAFETETQIQDYTWVEEPRVRVGSVNIPMESLMAMVIRQKEQDITEQLDQVISANVNLQGFIAKQSNTLAKGVEIHKGLLLTGTIDKVSVSHLKEEDDKLFIHILPSLSLLIRAKNLHQFHDIPPMPQMEWFYDIDKQVDHKQAIYLELSYDFLASKLAEAIDGQVVGGKALKVEQIHIRKKEQVYVDIHIKTPVDATIKVKGYPVYNTESGKVHVSMLDTKVEANNLLYKLSAPLISKVIEGRLEEMLPIPLEQIINSIWEEQRKKLPSTSILQYSIDIDRIRIENMNFAEDKALAAILIERPELEVFFS